MASASVMPPAASQSAETAGSITDADAIDFVEGEADDLDNDLHRTAQAEWCCFCGAYVEHPEGDCTKVASQSGGDLT